MFATDRLTLKDRLTLRAFLVTTAPRLQDQQRLRYEASNTSVAADRVTRFMVERIGSHTVLPRSVARELDGVLHFAPDAIPARQIPGGWQAERCNFALTVDYTDPMGAVRTFIVGGYTDHHPELLPNGQPNFNGVQFFVNSSVCQTISHIRGENGPVAYPRFSDAQHLLFDANWTGVDNHEETRVRPSDAFTSMATLQVLMASDNVVDTRTMNSALPVTAPRRHVIPSRYLAETLSAYFQGLNDPSSETEGPSEDLILSAARNATSSAPINQSFLFGALSAATGMMFNGQFSFSDLNKLFSDLDAKTVFVNMRDKNPILEDSPMDATANNASLFLGQAIPALLHSVGLSSVFMSIKVPEVDGDEPFSVVFVDVKRMGSEGPLTDRLNHIRAVIEREIVPELRHMGVEYGKFEIDSCVFIKTTVDYSINPGSGMSGKRHIATYADSLLSPLVAPSRDQATQFASDLYAVLTAAATGSHAEANDIDPFGF